VWQKTQTARQAPSPVRATGGEGHSLLLGQRQSRLPLAPTEAGLRLIEKLTPLFSEMEAAMDVLNGFREDREKCFWGQRRPWYCSRVRLFF